MSRLTPEQLAAVGARGNVLLSAGAGTGKTHTLTERCLRLLIEERASLENLLLVTFTEAAAAEMRERLRAALRQAAAQRPQDEHLARQVALLESARISTLHSFCLQLIREHFHELALDPQFSVLDERQTAPLRRAALDAVLEHFYGAPDPEAEAVRAMIRSLGRGRDGPVRNLVLRIHDYARALPDPEAWFEEQQRRFESPEPRPWRQQWLEAVSAWRQAWLPELESRRTAAPALERACDALRAWPQTPDVAAAASALTAVLAADQSQEGWPRGTKTRARKPIEDFFEEAAFLASYIPTADGSDPLAQDWELVRPHALALLRLTRAFAQEYAARKRELAGLDFADVEQFALRLLCEPRTGQPTALARAWREQLHHIFVDEYQDINGAQDAILTALGREGQGNRFLVGDVKQSIYRFRLANPKIFARYQHQWRHDKHGRVLALTGNFRSREPILNFVNAFIGALMRPEVGGVEYEPLLPGTAAEPRTGDADPEATRCVELHLLTRAEPSETEQTDEDEQTPPLAALEREARLIAHRLRTLKQSGLQIRDPDRETMRPVDWRDMAVLLRSPAGRAEVFAREFARLGVPLQAERPGFFSTLEVSDLLNLLRLMDNPLQDIPLVAVLRSPLAGFSPDELARIRAGSKARRFWTALEALAQTAEATPTSAVAVSPQTTALAAKAAEFVNRFRRWRELLRHTALSQCLETVLAETHYEALLHAESRGGERAANVRRLLDLTRQFDPYQREGLYRFLRFVQAQQDEALDLSAPPPPGGNAVTLLSIHKAKGLEFPVVVLAGMGTRFNEQNLAAPLLVNEIYGLGLRVCPSEAEPPYPSLTWWLARREEKRQLRAEELRLLYVALTRARDRLILVGDAPPQRARDAATKPAPTHSDAARHLAPLSTREVLNARSHLDWLLAWLPHAKAAGDLHRWVDCRIYTEDDAIFKPQETIPGRAPESAFTPTPATVLQTLQSRLQWRYPFESATHRSAKASVTELRERAVEAMDEEARWLFHFRGRVLANSSQRGATGAATLSGAEAGLAHHRFLERMALERADEVETLKAEAGRLVQQGHLSAAEAAALDLEAVAAFWGSVLGRRIRAESKHVHRELAFTARFTTAELDDLLRLSAGPTPEQEFVVVQGVADLVVIRPQELWLVDFKTDAVTPETFEATARRYQPQLRLYARALERIYRRPVRECALHFLVLRRTVLVA